jgi:membrane-bound lytic murein transglycosylase B
MQFLPATFRQYAVNADRTAPLSPYNPADAIYTAAAMLCASGAATGTPAGIRHAIFAYNHSAAYEWEPQLAYEIGVNVGPQMEAFGVARRWRRAVIAVGRRQLL